MSFKTITLFVAICSCIVLMTVSCSRYGVYNEPTVTVSKGNGPPAHAPAYGYHRKHIDGVELVFDSSLGLYIVVGHSDHYYHDGYFYRLSGGLWEISLKLDGGWKFASENSLPPGLKIKAKANDNNNVRGRGKDKHKKDVASMGKPF